MLRRAMLAGWVAAMPGLGGTAPAAAQEPWRGMADRLFRQVTSNDDVPRALLPRSIAEGPDGFLWLGGDSGLVRWDGYAFRDYPGQPTLPDGLRDNEISVLHRDDEGRFWAGTLSGGLGRLDMALGRLVCVPLQHGSCNGEHIWSMADDGAGGLWVGSSAGLIHLGRDGLPVTRPLTGLPAGDVLAVARDHQGVVWAGTGQGVYRSTDGGRDFTVFTALAGPAIAATSLMEDSFGRLWVGTRQQGAFVISAARTEVHAIAPTAPAAPSEPAVEVNALLEINPGVVWIGTEGHGITEVAGEKLQTTTILRNPAVPHGLSGNSVRALYRDRSGLVWISSDRGTDTYNAATSGVMTLFTSPFRPNGLPGEGVFCLLAAPDGDLWAGLTGAGFIKLDAQGGHATGLAGHRVFSIAPFTPAAPTPEAAAAAGTRGAGRPAAGAGKAFAGVILAADDGLFLADSDGRVTGRITLPDLPPTAKIEALTTVDGVVWLGTEQQGVWAFRIGADQHVTMVFRAPPSRLTNGTVEVIRQLADGHIAIGTDDGYDLFDPASGGLERVPADPAAADGLSAGFVSAFASDSHHRLWVGTSTGLEVMTGRAPDGRPQFHHLRTTDGLPNDGIDGLLTDRRGRIWASTDRGLAVIEPDSFKVRALRQADGVVISNYWSDSSAELPNGDLAFGGIGGLTIVKPDDLASWTYRPPVVVTAVQVGGHALPGEPDEHTTIEVPPDGNSISVEFAALDYSEPSQNRYAYRLDGFDTEWKQTDSAHRIADYTNLPPGKYRLRLRGSNREGVWSEPDTTLRIHVMPAWYQTFWFRLAALATLALTGMAGLRRWTDVLRRRQRELERQVAARTAELSQSQQQLQLANTELETRVAERTQALAERSAALEASEARFRAWFDHAEDAMFVVQVHPDGSFTYEAMNAAVQRIFNIDPAIGVGRGPAELLPPEYADMVIRRYQATLTGEAGHYENTYDGQHGERLLDTWLVPLRDPATGRVVRLVGASRDLTERRALERRLTQAQKLQALGSLAGGIAHDFNNILQAVSGAAMLMEQRPDDHAKILRLARSTLAAADRGTSITRRLLAFARSDALRVEALATLDVLEGVADVLKYTLGSAVQVKTCFAADLPPILADRGQLETALVNLGTNARDAMPGGGDIILAACRETVGTGESHPAALAPGAFVRIDVTDNGTGMDPATLARAVEPFFTTKPQGQGTGLGLAQVKGFAEQSGGQIAISSRLGQGTTISLWLREAPAMQGGAARGAAAAPQRLAARETILVVDDDALVRETLAEQLLNAGFGVQMAENGAQALQLLQAGRQVDALLCDLSMPGMDGVQVITAARVQVPGLACFLLTGFAGERAGLENAEGFKLLRKPIGAGALIAEIEAGLMAARH